MSKKPSERIEELANKIAGHVHHTEVYPQAIIQYLDERWKAEQEKLNSSFTDHLLNNAGSNAE